MSVPEQVSAAISPSAFVRRWGLLIGLAIILAFSVFVRIRLLEMPLERDEGEYAYAGQLMLQGIPPYKLAYNMKLPGTYVAYAGIMSAFGETTRGIHLGLILVNGGTILLIYLLSRQMFGRSCGMVAAGSFALLSLSDSVLGLAAHATHFVALFAISGAFFLWTYMQKGSIPFLFFAGISFGLSFVMKQQGVFFPIFGAAMFLWHTLRKGDPRRQAIIVRTSVYLAGLLLPFAIACLALVAAGVFSRFWFWTILYARQYASITPLARGWKNFQLAMFYFATSAPALWLIVGLGFILLLRGEEDRKKLGFIVGFFFAAFAAACPGLYFREHYFIPLLLPASILAGIGIERLFILVGQRGWKKGWLLVPVALFAIAAADMVLRSGKLFFKLKPDAAARAIYVNNPFPEAVVIARYIREHSDPRSSIAVVGSEPEIYFYSGRHSATGYIYTYPLMEPHPYAARMQQEMITEIEAAKPEYVVFVDIARSWLAKPTSNPLIIDWFEQYAASQLRTVGLVEIFVNTPSTYRWDDKAIAVTPRSASYIKVFKRRDLF
jgi:4-amino-4-deoxy-L-arabinose transferase-like glycosyltransferase